jgi:hypothetical protein
MVAALALALTRPIVLPLAVVIAIHGVIRWRKRAESPFPASELRRCAAVAGVAVGSFALWPAICALRTGVPNGYMQTQDAWISAVAGPPTWLSAVLHGFGGAAATAAVLAVVVLLAAVIRRTAPSWGLEWKAWALTYSAYLFLVTLPAAAVLRYAILTVVPWWPVNPATVDRSPQRRAVAIVLVVAFGALFQVLWMKYYYVIGPHFQMNP